MGNPNEGAKVACNAKTVKYMWPMAEHLSMLYTGAVSEPPKPYEPIGILRWLYKRFFAHIQVDENWSKAVQQAARQGVVVHVMRSISYLDFLCLDFLLKKYGLPAITFVNDLGLSILEPFGRGNRRLLFKRQVPQDNALKATLMAHTGALLFLRRPPRWRQLQPMQPSTAKSAKRGSPLEIDLLRTLVEAQRLTDQPILLLPQTFVWSKRPPSQRMSVTDLLFGPTEWPGRIRVLLLFIFNYKNALLRSGEPFDVKAFIEANPDLNDAQLADKVRYALMQRLERERTVVLGPMQKTPQRIRDEILRSPRVVKLIENSARAKGALGEEIDSRAVEKVRREADRDLIKLCAATHPSVIGMFHRFLHWLFNNVFDGLVVDKEGIERVRHLGREAAVVFLPCHKSHIDYLLLSEVLYSHQMTTPVIAAGENLNFWPVGPVLRRGGAFFIKRSFRGQKLYSALVEAYIRKLVVEGFNIEFFIEGGRSRTGKLLEPKLGLLSMIMEAANNAHVNQVYFVPVAITYERVAEQTGYMHELSGGEKQKDTLGKLLRFLPGFFGTSHGRIYVQFGKDFSLTALREQFGKRHGDALTPSEKRGMVQRAAHLAVSEINQATTLTSAAMSGLILLSHRRRGMAFKDITLFSETLRDLIAGQNIRYGLDFDVITATRSFAEGKWVQVHEGESICSVPEDKRAGLEYYKNSAIHFFLPHALIASAVISTESSEPLTDAVLVERVQWMTQLLKHEFVLARNGDMKVQIEEALNALIQKGHLLRDPVIGHIHISAGRGGQMIALLANMLRTYFEAYRLVLRGLHQPAVVASKNKKDWVKQTLALGQRMYLSGEVELRESLVVTKIENALLSYHDLGLLRISTTQEVKVNAEHPDIVSSIWDHRLSAMLGA